MLQRLLASVLPSRNDRLLKQYRRIVDRVNALEESMKALDDEGLAARTVAFRERHAGGESLDELLPEAFAAVREAARRTLGLRHYDVQLIGGMTLHFGKIAEMRTGEGKTLVATLPVYLNAIAGKGVHVVTVNDYLAKRDANWMGPVYQALGMSVGVVVPGMRPEDKRAAYAADITYGTNNEYGFDYLRDNMALSTAERYQRGQFFAIVDEVDSILIDEARTPLIISGPADESPQLYARINKVMPSLVRQKEEEGEGDFWVDEKQKQVHLSESGMERAEALLREAAIIKPDDSLYDAHNIVVVHHLNAGLRAHNLYQRDVDYIVREGEVVIVDEFTGRTLAGRRWSDGLHQAVEAKEGVPVQRENQTLASITFQNYFRMYKKLGGMTGTADTEAYEFQQIYGLEVVVIPTHRAMVRMDNSDLVFLKPAAKFNAVIDDIKDCHQRGQPVLVGTTSIETSEYLAGLLRKAKIQHEVLNAKQHEREAQIVALAGRPGAVTIATNMAGRGTDIVLGGNAEVEIHSLGADASDADKARVREEWKERHSKVLASGGLHIIGTERHESRRIDNQLRGRSGRQGDPGSSRFYLSLEDSLMRIFASDFVTKVMRFAGMKDDEAIESKMVSKQIANAQRKVEAHNFDIRKNLLEYDDVANDQRKVIYEQRNELLEASDVRETVDALREDVLRAVCGKHVPPESVDDVWDLPALERELESDFTIRVDLQKLHREHEDLAAEQVWQHVLDAADRHFREKEAQIGSDVARMLERHIMLSVLDTQWKDHLANMDYMRQGIHLRGYAQKQPKQEFKMEAFRLFEQMLEKVQVEVATTLARVRLRSEEELAQIELEQRMQQQRAPMKFQHEDAGSYGVEEEAQQVQALRDQSAMMAATPAQVVRDAPKVGRNDPCPCGSGKKYKQCHGRLE